MSYLKENPVKSSVYVQSGSVYAILLIGASTSEGVSIVVAHDFKEKNLLKTCFVINNLRDKLLFEEAKDTVSNIQKADILFSDSSDFVSRNPSKTSLFYVESQSRNPNSRAIMKVSQSEACGSVKTVADDRQALTTGLYVTNSKSGTPSPPLPPKPQLPKDTNYQPKYIKNKLQKTYVPDFVCKNDFFNNWNQGNAQVYSSKGEFKI